MEARGWDVAKYFVHGLALGVLFLIVGAAWTFVIVLLVICGLWIGLATGLVLFFVLIGYLNGYVAWLLWFPVRTGFVPTLGHGVLLFLALLPLNLVVLGVHLLVTPDLLVSLGIFIVTAPAFGYVAKRVAGVWEIRSYDVARFGELPPGPSSEGEAAPLVEDDDRE